MTKKINKSFYENKLNTALYNLHSEGRYRTFIEIERTRGSFPSARWVAENDVEKSDIPVLIDFWATWCGPCKAIAPLIEEVASEFEGKIKVGKVDVDQNQGTAMKFGVRSIPTLLVIKNGEVVNQLVGAVPKNNITDILNEVL